MFHHCRGTHAVRTLALARLSASFAIGGLVACQSDDSSPKSAADASTVMSDAGLSQGSPDASTGTASCASPGAAISGAAASRCVAEDGGVALQRESEDSCCDPAVKNLPAICSAAPDGGDDEDACDYGATLFGTSGYDDDCKYDVSWTSTPLCEGTGGVEFTVTAKDATDGSPVTGGSYKMEAFTTTPGDPSSPSYCDNQSLHPSPTDEAAMTETPAGSGIYKVKMVFDAAGKWTIRFHFHENCADVLDDSPHGHAAFFVNIP